MVVLWAGSLDVSLPPVSLGMIWETGGGVAVGVGVRVGVTVGVFVDVGEGVCECVGVRVGSRVWVGVAVSASEVSTTLFQ